ncbi:MAG: hypothetical protein QN159_08865 [Armatimonadota bacterium]|nr:hypothetical protein [Armatimonadota bacterium]
MRRWHDDLPIMLARRRASRRRFSDIPSGSTDYTHDRRAAAGCFRKRPAFGCGGARCYLCHCGKLVGYRPPREAVRRGRRNARAEALRRQADAWGDAWYDTAMALAPAVSP